MHGAGPPDHTSYANVRAWFKADLGVQRAYPWVLFGPYVALVALYFPLERGKLRLHMALNLAACVGFLLGSHQINGRTSLQSARVVILRSQEQVSSAEANPGGLKQILPALHPAFPPPTLPGQGMLSLLLDLVAYCAIVGLAHSVHFYRRLREREHQALLLESNLNQARLNALRAQLQPHFLFNSLNAIAALLRRDPRLAEATLLSLSELLRLALSQSERQLVPLRDEINLVGHYLEIQQTRFGDKLQVQQEIELTALDCLVPTLLLQPVIENALRHGIEPAENGGLVRLTAHRAEHGLVLTVADNGVGLATGKPANGALPGNDSSSLAVPRGGNGIGLSNLRARLETLYGTRQSLELAARPEGGVTVRIQIPWQPADTTDAALVCRPL